MAYSTNAPPPVKQGRLITTPTSQVVVNALYPSAVGVDVHHDLLVCAYQYLDLEKSEICTELNEFRCSSVSGRVNVNRFGHLKVNIRTCKSEQKSEHFSCVRTARSVAIKGRRPSALRAFTPPLAAVEARGAGEPGPFELRLCGPFPCRKVVAA